MRSTRQLSVTLPDEIIDEVQARVASGEYASESEVVREGLRALQERDQPIETWLQETVVPDYLAYRADPSTGVSFEDVKADLAARHEKALPRG